jgi:hypothetical protein
VRPKVMLGAPTGLLCRTQLVSSLRGVRCHGMRETWPAQLVVERLQSNASVQRFLFDSVSTYLSHFDSAQCAYASVMELRLVGDRTGLLSETSTRSRVEGSWSARGRRTSCLCL